VRGHVARSFSHANPPGKSVSRRRR
jgi:hypothetical protein